MALEQRHAWSARLAGRARRVVGTGGSTRAPQVLYCRSCCLGCRPLFSTAAKSTAVRGYAETHTPRLPLTAGGYGPTGTTVHPMTRPPADDLERPTQPM